MDTVVVAAIVGALLVVVVVLALLRRRPSRSCVVLYGPSSGKSALWLRLKTGKFQPTVASMKENGGTFVWAEDSEGGMRHTVDIPGHARLRWRLKDFLPITKWLVVMLDATAMGGLEYAKDAAEMVWEAVHTVGPQVVIACNKSDDLLALSSKKIKSELEKHMAVMARTRTKHPALHEGGETEAVEESSSSQAAFVLDPAVQFVVISVKKGDLKPLFQCLRQ